MRIKRPDHKEAESLLDAAEREMEFTLTLPLSEASVTTIIRNIYESFRMLGDALLLLQGEESDDHVQPIRELMKLEVVTKRPLQVLDHLRLLRHNINYYGYRPSGEEAQDAISIAKDCFAVILKEIRGTQKRNI